MPQSDQQLSDSLAPLDRRELLAYSAAFGSAFVAAAGLAGSDDAAAAPIRKAESAPKRYDMKKSINMWAFPYPQKWTLKESFELAKDAGFDGIEVNYALSGDISPEASEADLKRIGQMARKIGIEISGVCSFLFWPYSLSSNDAVRRQRGLQLAEKMTRAAAALGTDNLLVVPGAVYIPWQQNTDPWPEVIEPVPNDICHARATAAVRKMLPLAEKLGVSINIENIFANGFLFSPAEMNAFVDQFKSKHVQIHFDTGNIMEYQFPEHWIPILGKRTKNIHFKEFDKKTAFNLDSFRTLLDGTTNWPAVIAALDKVGYRGYLTFEYFHPFPHYPEALLYSTSDALDRMLGRKT